MNNLDNLSMPFEMFYTILAFVSTVLDPEIPFKHKYHPSLFVIRI